MLVEIIDDFIEITTEFRDKIFDHKLHLSGNEQAPFHLNKEAMKNLVYVNISPDSDSDCDLRTYSNLGWQKDLGMNFVLTVQDIKVPFISFEKIYLN